MIEPGIFPYVYHCGKQFQFFIQLSAMDWYLELRILSRRKPVFFLPVDPRNERHKDPEYIDFSAPRLARYMHKAWKRHQDAVFWV